MFNERLNIIASPKLKIEKNLKNNYNNNNNNKMYNNNSNNYNNKIKALKK